MKYYNCQQTDELYVKYDQIIEPLTSEVKMKKKKNAMPLCQSRNSWFETTEIQSLKKEYV